MLRPVCLLTQIFEGLPYCVADISSDASIIVKIM